MLLSTETLVVVALHLKQLLEVNFAVDLALKSSIGTSTVVCVYWGGGGGILSNCSELQERERGGSAE